MRRTSGSRRRRFDHDKTAFPLTGRAREGRLRELPPGGGAGQAAAVQGHALRDLRELPSRSARGAAGRAVRVVPHHRGLVEDRQRPASITAARASRSPAGTRRVACQRCHPAAPGGGLKFQGIAFQNCSSCHKDPHAGRLGAQCASCHNTGGWAKVEGGNFDHDRTGLPAARQARARSSATPATSRAGPRQMAHARCTDCHEDRHAGPARAAARRRALRVLPRRGRLRARAVRPRRPRPARVSRSPARTSPWPATIATRRSRASACAPSGSPATAGAAATEQLRFASTACVECHRDPHRGQTARLGTCETCHAVDAWATVRFDHSRTAFPLVGSPRRAALPELPSRGRRRARAFRPPDRLHGLPPGSPRRPFRAQRAHRLRALPRADAMGAGGELRPRP